MLVMSMTYIDTKEKLVKIVMTISIIINGEFYGGQKTGI